MVKAPSRLVVAGLLLLLVGVVLSSAPALAASRDTAIRNEVDRVMNELFATARFREARAALERALSRCKPKKACTPRTTALVHLNLGAIWITGLGSPEQGARELGLARSLDPELELDEMVATPEVKRAFDAALEEGAEPADVVLDEDEEPEGAPEEPAERGERRSGRPECAEDSDCARGRECHDGACEETSSSPLVWLSLGIIQDAAFASGNDVCTKESQVSEGYTCLRASGSQYHGTPLPGRGGQLGGASLATTRVVLASHVPLGGPVSGSLHVGYAFLGQGPQPDGGKDFVWAHAEARLAYWLTGRAFQADGPGAFVEASGGIQEIDGHAQVTVTEDPAAPPPSHQIDNPPSQKLEAYQKGGTGFGALGVGAFLPLGGVGLVADFRVLRLFPRGVTAMSVGFSLALGL